MHTDRCRFAKTDKKKCHCSCDGVLHGLGSERLDPNERILTEEDGGEVGEFIKKYGGKKYICYGHSKNNIHTANTFYGYLHDGGLSDKNGNKWWLFIYCQKTRYQTSFMHLPQNIERYEKNEKNKIVIRW
jgi:hypothetical protein